MEYMFLPLKRYADFSGRSRRKEYWMFLLGYVLLMMVTAILAAVVAAAASTRFTGPFFLLFGLLTLGLLIPSLAVQVRRFHDQDKSGWFWLLNFVPYVGGIIVLVFMCLEGTKGPNRFGPDPKEVENLSDIFS
ncbi:DUF805 domain-containing protein [Sphingobium chlorophenolicum]|uniref:DUF805 domain-containing protein n=1 Tax=Sphingobium chlorophenolicum TaxID=46429 RepID=A0A081RBL9_SPHCR|nr:DUF805 domain-containing protein [Sphingobium chlorophenolicum]KEQ52592.1 putative uncharacterized protein precursor [Sphingobium chlorophenolicum]